MIKYVQIISLTLLATFFSQEVLAYPIDGFWYTGIRRLIHQEKLVKDSLLTSRLEPGALLKMHEIQLFLTDEKEWNGLETFPKEDEVLQKKVNSLFYGLDNNYSISVLDITEGSPARYAERRETVGYQPGSVGKLMVLTALFHELNEIYPGDWEKQREVLTNRFVTGGKFAVPNSHTVPFYDINSGKLTKRHPNEKDIFSLYEWLDHMTSVSSNAAASICYREMILMYVFKDRYECLEETESDKWFEEIAKDSLSNLANHLIHRSIRELGITEEEWRLGQPFTRGASNVIRPQGGSTGTTQGLMKWLIALEKGKIVNERSSLEMKRLIYITDRRIRYGASHALDDAMLCFKSGSLYSCKPEAGYSCKKYAGNRYNYMNSLAIVEHEDCTRYLVILLSNVLKKNSAGDHYGLASQIDKLVREKHKIE